MAIVRMTGVVEIDLGDLYGGFERQVKELGDYVGQISFSKSENAVLVSRPDGSEIARGPAEDFWTWVATSALPESLRDFEVAYRVPKVDADQGGLLHGDRVRSVERGRPQVMGAAAGVPVSLGRRVVRGRMHDGS
jgi:hypothetical protein